MLSRRQHACGFGWSMLLLGILPAAQADPAFDLLNVPSIAGNHKTYYVVSVENMPIGVAGFSIKEEDLGATESDLRILMRVGATPLVLRLRSELNKAGVNIQGVYFFKKEQFGNANWLWSIENNAYKSTDSIIPLETLLLGNPAPASRSVLTRSPITTFVPFQKSPQKFAESRFFSPLTGNVFSAQEISPSFAEGPMPISFSLPLSNGISLRFSQPENDDFKTILSEIRNQNTDPAWFSSKSTIREDISELKSTIQQCNTFTTSTEGIIKRKSPSVPYLLHRKIVNFQTLCNNLQASLFVWESQQNSSEALLASISKNFKATEKEPRRELPITLANSPEIPIFRKPALQWQFIKAAAHLIRKTQAEVATLIRIDQHRKTSLELTISALRQEPRAVLRANLRSKKSDLRMGVEVLKDNSTTPEKSPHVLDGKDFALSKNPDVLVQTTCENANGAITLNLADRENFVLRSDMARGIWDESTRIQILVEFLNRVTSIPTCSLMNVRIPQRIERDARGAIEVFRHDVLQTENEFQVSNGKTTRLKTFPGTYELTLTSFVSGRVIGKQEVVIEEKDKSKLRLTFK
jgi:hypothetical protein